MKNRMFIASLLVTIIVASCSPAATSAPIIIPPTPTPTAIPTNTNSIPPSQAVETQAGTLIKPYQDVRFEDLRTYGILGEALIKTLWFDQTTIWSEQDQKTAQNILNLGMDPGLGIRDLHREGITGKGVTVAIIDQNMVLDHPEFQGKIVKYYDAGTNRPANEGSMHGPAVTSLLVGENIGTAPDANVYFIAVPSWLLDAQYYADAIDWIINENKKLPDGGKIRVVSVSVAASGIWSPFNKNKDAWDAAYKRASDAGILILDCTYEYGFTNPCTYDLNDPDNVAKCIPDWRGPTDSPHQRINIPTSRTTATEVEGDNKVLSYQYTGLGGLSWSVPFMAGVLAMGWQINPGLSSSQLLDILFASAYVTRSGEKIISPKAFIEKVRLTVKQ